MRYRDACVGWDGDGGCHARHDFERHSGCRNGFGFFPASPKDEGIAALQPSKHQLNEARIASDVAISVSSPSEGWPGPRS